MSCSAHLLAEHRLPSVPDFIEVGLNFKIKLGNLTHAYGEWTYTYPCMGITGTDDHLILDGLKVGNYIHISFKCLSKDRSRRYKLELELLGGNSGRKKTTSGETLLMTEDLEVGLAAGNVLEIHEKAFEKFQRSGHMTIRFNVVGVRNNIEGDGAQETETNSKACPQTSSGPGVKRSLEDKAGEANKRTK